MLSTAGCCTDCTPLPPQASAEQLRVGLNEMSALLLAGRWRVVDDIFLGGLLELLVLRCSSESAYW